MAISKNIHRLCREDVSLIENYDKAIADDKNTWVCHHRDEIRTLPSGITVIRSPEEPKCNGRYYNCPANELIFMTRNEHNALHSANRSEESLEKLSVNTAKNHAHYWNGRKKSAEHIARIAASRKGIKVITFARKFREHFGIKKIDNLELYQTEYEFYKQHKRTASWEV